MITAQQKKSEYILQKSRRMKLIGVGATLTILFSCVILAVIL
jgi:hypothetical protein